MASAQHLSSLQKKHHALEERIRREMQRPAVNDQMIRQLKAQKLHLKEQITQIAGP